MPQPPQYQRQVDFTDRDGDDTNHAGINAELDAVAAFIAQARTNMALLQQDDGGLKPLTVGPDQLTPEAFTALQGAAVVTVQTAVDAAQSAITSAISAAQAAADAAAAIATVEAARDASLINANNALTRANAAAASATAAAASATTATNQATAAANSATAAAASATTATNQATNAATSAANAATQAGNSATSAAASAGSAAAAAGSATAADASADAAAASAVAADNSADAAAASAVAADASADAAAASAATAEAFSIGLPRVTTGTLTRANVNGKVFVVSANQAIPANEFQNGDVFGIENNSGASITLTPNGLLTLYLASTGATGVRTLGPRGLAVFRNVSGIVAYVSGPGVS